MLMSSVPYRFHYLMFLTFKNTRHLKQNYLLFYSAGQMGFSRLDMSVDRYHIHQGQLDIQASFGSLCPQL